MRPRTPGLLLFLAACSASSSGVPGDDTTGDDTSGDDTPVEPDAAEATPVVRFAAIGDAGKGNEGQRQVAIAMRDHCAAEGCDFIFMLGDNIYDAGVSGTDDPQWQEKFEVPYADLDLPFYAVLGNHDYGGEIIGFEVGGLGNQWDRGPHEVAYTEVSQKWTMPSTFYTLRRENVGIIALDTNSILWENTDHGDQNAWWPTALAEVEGAEWTLLIGHHPYRSNGTHGDAGNYDAPELAGIPIPNPLPIQNGAAMKAFFDDVVCGTGDLYISGHDHSRQWINEPSQLCGTEMVVSGAGATVTELPGTTNQTHYQDASKIGFFYVEIEGKTLRGQFYDAEGNLDFERVITKP
jgi:hypothetical protein